MNRDADPYRTLGLARSATLDEVKRAYRRLAKANHPDSAGEAALPRFLAIQSAYEKLAGGIGGPGGGTASGGQRGNASRGGGSRGADKGTDPGSRRPPGTNRERDRGDATHRAYGARARRPAGDQTGGRAGHDRTAGTGQGTRGRTGSGDRPEQDRSPNRATPGSTSYDGAADEPFDPDWAGASWYGTSSGTYWTINPKEYADPRKHGPEYQARARRAARSEIADAASGADATVEGPSSDAGPGLGGSDAGSPADPERAAGPERPAEASGTPPPVARPARTSTWTAGADHASPEPGERARTTPPRPPDPDPIDVARSSLRALLDGEPIGAVGRSILAIAGGLPIVAGLGWVIGEGTGCARFAATCQTGFEVLLVIAAVVVLALLVALPRVASVAAVGTLALVVASVPTAVLLSATGGSRLPETSATVLGVVLVVAWIGGAAYALGRRRGSPPATGRPVS